ncbi:hypothetical protein ACH5RR_035310 [Cinchona calisaya]|uniref:DUF241 domain protein n=1 Tax=Cinchona calisaya TaxID=153742 RepID=A0ABD2YDH2_9GENT
MACHIRSNSLPSTSHPTIATVEHHLRILKAHDASTSSSVTSICSNLSILKELHEGVTNLIQLPSVQNALSTQQLEKWVEEVLDGSLSLLDACGSARDIKYHIKESVKDFESSIRRNKNGVFGLTNKVKSFEISRKKINKMVVKNIRILKKLEKNCSSQLLNKDSNLATIISLLKETETISFLILRSVLAWASDEKERSKYGGWSLVTKFVQPKRVHYVAEQEEEVYGLEKVDEALHALLIKSQKGSDACALQNVLKQLKSLEFSIQEFEENLEDLFKSLIKRRVSLLNVLNN